ncbi:MAG: hypothetical protein GAK29_00903 [Acinetobacter bereziniae]|uniref:Uncharacterized protein n=1 Tax=Acinetobacter bereziniae TaxID=106648 RepID=A0A833PIH7_ACIBZ|nr:MAG: hypothetical protein GAK29_00903 [Acinetobacter bereziniae]
MSKEIIAQDLNDANDQWWIDHDAYADALEEFRSIELELQDALGVVRICKPGEGALFGDILEGLERNRDEFGLINRFKSAYKKMIEAKGKL